MADPVFFAAARRFSAGEIATVTGSALADPVTSSVEITGIAPAAEGGAGTLIFIDGRRNAGALASVKAAAVLCTEDVVDKVPAGIAVLVTPAPSAAFAAVGRLMFPAAVMPEPITGEKGISAHAHIDPAATIESGATVEAGAVVGAEAAIGRGSVIGPNAVIGRQCRVGRDCYVGPGVTIQHALVGDRVRIHPGVRIGQDGFGYASGKNGLEKVPQIGRVVIQSDVEIGANTTIDRGALSDTVIGEGTKIDNLVQIAHNVKIGRGCIVAGLSGLSGSVTLGDHVMLGGRAGITDHLTIGSRAQLAAGSGLMHDMPANARWAGAPAKPIRQFFRELTVTARLSRPATNKSDTK